MSKTQALSMKARDLRQTMHMEVDQDHSIFYDGIASSSNAFDKDITSQNLSANDPKTSEADIYFFSAKKFL